jgi:hypothetical protein
MFSPISLKSPSFSSESQDFQKKSSQKKAVPDLLFLPCILGHVSNFLSFEELRKTIIVLGGNRKKEPASEEAILQIFISRNCREKPINHLSSLYTGPYKIVIPEGTSQETITGIFSTFENVKQFLRREIQYLEDEEEYVDVSKVKAETSLELFDKAFTEYREATQLHDLTEIRDLAAFLKESNANRSVCLILFEKLLKIVDGRFAFFFLNSLGFEGTPRYFIIKDIVVSLKEQLKSKNKEARLLVWKSLISISICFNGIQVMKHSLIKDIFEIAYHASTILDVEEFEKKKELALSFENNTLKIALLKKLAFRLVNGFPEGIDKIIALIKDIPHDKGVFYIRMHANSRHEKKCVLLSTNHEIKELCEDIFKWCLADYSYLELKLRNALEKATEKSKDCYSITIKDLIEIQKNVIEAQESGVVPNFCKLLKPIKHLISELISNLLKSLSEDEFLDEFFNLIGCKFPLEKKLQVWDLEMIFYSKLNFFQIMSLIVSQDKQISIKKALIFKFIDLLSNVQSDKTELCRLILENIREIKEFNSTDLNLIEKKLNELQA